MFNNSRDFYIKNLYASDEGNDVATVVALVKLVNAACLGAGHQSDERYDAPKCHPETRAAVINNIMSWANAKESREPVMWMSGPAGAGKSAIAQTVCEKLDGEQKLLASFFFSRTAGSERSEGKRLVPTIAFRAISIPELKPMIIKQLITNTAMSTYSMEIQLHRLVLEPLAEMYKKAKQDKSRTDGCTPYVVVIDGLDECNDRDEQSRIVRMISGICGTELHKQIQLRFLIASRPELEIRNSFESIIDRGTVCARIVLNQTYYNSDEDIRTYLFSEFSALKREHTLRHYLQQEIDWPSPYDINNLVMKSSGQFIYAATILKYLRNARRDPRHGLRGILDTDAVQINSIQSESPYISLDSLYKHVLTSSSTSHNLFMIVFQVLLFSNPLEENIHHDRWRDSMSDLRRTLKNLSEFAGITQSELELLLVDLHSLISIPDNSEMDFYHASLADFLKDKSRSQNFYISETEAHKYIAKRCLSVILEISPERVDMLTEAQNYSVDRFFQHFRYSNFDEELLTMLRSETTLSAVLEILSTHKRYHSLNHVIIYSFDDQESASQPYWIPRLAKMHDICLAIVKFVEKIFFIKFRSVGTLNGYDVIRVLFCHTNNGENRLIFYLRWLSFLLKSPMNGNHLYLDREKYFFLYKKLVQETDRSTRRYYGNGEDGYFPILLRYLLQKIQPSADIDVDVFPRASEQALNEITESWFKTENIKDHHSAIEMFFQKCRLLKRQQEEQLLWL